MDASEFNRLLSTDHYSPADLDQVGDLCRNYPMFSLAHLLRVRIMESLSYEKDRELKLAAIYAGDRSRLFELVDSCRKAEGQKEELSGEPGEHESITFTDEASVEADVIIGQHAPYAVSQTDNNLLELDEEGEISAENLIEAVAKDEAELEDPEVEDVESEDSGTPVIRDPEEEASGDKGEEGRVDGQDSGNDLILNFLREDPGPIRADRETPSKGDISKASVREHDGFITDTLAQIYVKQRLYAKAIYAYEKLSLKYPEKSAYFAAQIEKIRNINHS